MGWELQRALAPLGNLIALDVHSTDYCGDFSNPQGVADTVRRIRPDVIVNAAAHTAIDKAESEVEFARLLNTTSVEAIARAAAEIGAWVVHYSTDYVFLAPAKHHGAKRTLQRRLMSTVKPNWREKWRFRRTAPTI